MQPGPTYLKPELDRHGIVFIAISNQPRVNLLSFSTGKFTYTGHAMMSLWVARGTRYLLNRGKLGLMGRSSSEIITFISLHKEARLSSRARKCKTADRISTYRTTQWLTIRRNGRLVNIDACFRDCNTKRIQQRQILRASKSTTVSCTVSPSWWFPGHLSFQWDMKC